MTRTLAKPSMIEGGGGVAYNPDYVTYPTLGAAAAASPGANVTSFVTLGRNAMGDHAPAFWVYTTAPSTGAFITCANGRKFELTVSEVNVKFFGARGDGVTDDSEAFRQAFSFAQAKGIPVYAPAGTYKILSAIVLTAQQVFYGDGIFTRLRGLDLTTEIFRFNLGSGSINFSIFRDFAADVVFSNGGVAASAAVFRVVGTGNPYFQYNTFRNIDCFGFPVFFQSDAPSHPTGFGNEGPVNWCDFDGIRFNSFSREQLFGFIFNTGSGTGNTFRRIGGKIDQSAWLYQSGAYVVGDICITEMGQWQSANTATSTLMTIGDGTQYRSRISIRGGQLDAGFARVFSLSSIGAQAYSNIIADVMLGGAATWGPHPALATSYLGPPLGTVAAA